MGTAGLWRGFWAEREDSLERKDHTRTPPPGEGVKVQHNLEKKTSHVHPVELFLVRGMICLVAILSAFGENRKPTAAVFVEKNVSQ